MPSAPALAGKAVLLAWTFLAALFVGLIWEAARPPEGLVEQDRRFALDAKKKRDAGKRRPEWERRLAALWRRGEQKRKALN